MKINLALASILLSVISSREWIIISILICAIGGAFVGIIITKVKQKNAGKHVEDLLRRKDEKNKPGI